MKTRDLLLEVGTEEIPARMLPDAAANLLDLVTTALKEVALAPEGGHAYYTPRRLAVVMKGIPVVQPDREETAYGPPVTAAFDQDGTPTKAAMGFARSQGVGVADLLRLPGPKGAEVVAVRRLIGGRQALDLLSELLPRLLARIQFPKSMRWGTGIGPFVRPVHWVCCLFGDQVVPFEFCGVASSHTTRGHRFLFPEPVVVPEPSAYVELLASRGVVVVPEERRR